MRVAGYGQLAGLTQRIVLSISVNIERLRVFELCIWDGFWSVVPVRAKKSLHARPVIPCSEVVVS